MNNNNKDDGRTVAEMNIPGMPWYAGPSDRHTGAPQGEKKNSLEQERIVLSKGEKRAIYKGVMAAILPLVMAFAVGYFLIFLFLDLVWLG
ncbi:hypothetical protein PBV87_04020 [Niameybacter massiliensis]|uniref:Uncharacterized protein n=1 Tax=Holtiella tumoricola TaxID=3018743 RepID=A0AA42DKL4_9FIRM|nr:MULTISPECIES: hypothetical protein [Lachnospirales]MDA3730665.1 hypothetical protein [Holtiella tumoricola]